MKNLPFRLTMDASLMPSPCQFGLIWSEGVRAPQVTASVPSVLSPLLSAIAETGDAYVPASVRQRVRSMLRYGKYKPSGRSKPASEFLLRAALRQEFPLVNEPVDVNNAISLESGFPGSIFDAGLCGRHLLARRGRQGETYVFNPSGQTIELEDLLLVCRDTERGWVPCGNPVRDAMDTKVSAVTVDLVAVLYIPMDEPVSSAELWCGRYAERLGSVCAAARTGWSLVRDTGIS